VSMRTSTAKVKEKIALSILKKIMKVEQPNYARAQEFMRRYELSRTKFLKILNLYCVLSFISMFKRVETLMSQS